MKKKVVVFTQFILLFFLLSFSTSAQLADTIRYSLQQKPKFYLTLASFNTFIDGDYANFGGFRTGLTYNQRIRFGIGYFWLSNNSVVSNIQVNTGQQDYLTNGELHLHYFSFSAEYFFYKKDPWLLTGTPFQLGIGKAYYRFFSVPENQRMYTPKELVILYQPELSAQYSVLEWLGVGVTAGYRFTLLRSKKTTEQLSAPMFSFDIRLFLDEIWKLLSAGDQAKEN